MEGKELTMGSLFSGSSGFELASLMAGIRPVWASEVEPYPIRVTTKRMPWLRHLGDIHDIRGGEIEPVDIITGGSPCQDVSIAGKRSHKGDEGEDGWKISEIHHMGERPRSVQLVRRRGFQDGHRGVLLDDPIKETMDWVKNTKEGQMKFSSDYARWRNEGIEEGRVEGREEGREEVRMDAITSILRKGKLSIAEIADSFNLPVSRVEEIARRFLSA